MNERDFKRFRTIAKVLSIIALIVVIGMSISTIASICIFIALLILNESKVTNLIQENRFDVLIEPPNGLDIGLDYAKDVVYDKPAALLLVGVAIIYAIVVLVITFYAYKLFKNMANEDIFAHENSRLIRVIGYLFIALTVLYSVRESVNDIAFYRMFKDALDSLDISMQFNLIQINFPLLLSSIIILLIGYAFKYGLFLKEEYDQTV